MNQLDPHKEPMADNQELNPQESHPDVPRGVDEGFYWDRYVRQVYVRKDNIGYIIYDSAQSDATKRIAEGKAPFTIEKSGTGVILLKNVAKTYSIQVFSYGGTTNTITAEILENGDSKISITNPTGGSARDGQIYINWIRL